jgi:hypothetical protein
MHEGDTLRRPQLELIGDHAAHDADVGVRAEALHHLLVWALPVGRSGGQAPPLGRPHGVAPTAITFRAWAPWCDPAWPATWESGRRRPRKLGTPSAKIGCRPRCGLRPRILDCRARRDAMLPTRAADLQKVTRRRVQETYANPSRPIGWWEPNHQSVGVNPTAWSGATPWTSSRRRSQSATGGTPPSRKAPRSRSCRGAVAAVPACSSASGRLSLPDRNGRELGGSVFCRVTETA